MTKTELLARINALRAALGEPLMTEKTAAQRSVGDLRKNIEIMTKEAAQAATDAERQAHITRLANIVLHAAREA